MNYQIINLISSLITKNYFKLIFVSKHLFRQIKLNKEYLEYIYDYFEDTDMKGIEINYIIELYRELVKSNCEYSNIIFNVLNNNEYYHKKLDIDIIKQLVEMKVVNNKNLIIDFYHERGVSDVIKYVISTGIYNKKTVIIKACKANNLNLIKFLVEELKVKLDSSTIPHRYYISNNNVFKYIFPKISNKENINLQNLLYDCPSRDLSIFKFLMEETNIEYPTIEKIIFEEQIEKIKYLIEERHINIEFDTFFEAIKKVCFHSVKYLDEKYGFDINTYLKNELIKYISKLCLPKKEMNDEIITTVEINGVIMNTNDGRYDMLKFLSKKYSKI